MDWYTEAKEKRANDPSYGYGKIAKEYGLTYDTVRNKFRRDPENKQEVQKVDSCPLDKQLQELLSNGKPYDKIYLCDKYNVAPKMLSFALDKLKSEGIQIEENSGGVFIQKLIIPKSNIYENNWGGEKIIRFGAIADTHLGSKWEQLNFLQKLYKIYQSEGIKDVYHAGDITEGIYKNRPGHIYEIKNDCLGVTQQVNHVVNNYPDNCTTYYIAGNHDSTHMMNGGANIGEMISSRRSDLKFLGFNNATINLTPKCKMELVHPNDGSCFDDKTEIMTQNGWKLFKDLSIVDKVATMTKDEHKFEWQNPTEITKQFYSGDMLHFKSRTVDMLVSPNHGMWVRENPIQVNRKLDSEIINPKKSHPRKNLNWRRETAQHLLNNYGSKQRWQFTNCCEKWEGIKIADYVEVPYIESKNRGMDSRMRHIGKISLKDFCELVAWYVTEGNCGKKSVTIAQYLLVNPENHQQIVNLFRRIGVEPQITDKCIRLGSLELATFLKDTCGHLSHHKFIPNFIKELPSEYLKIVFETMIKGDGWRNGVGFGYRSVSPHLINDLAEIAIKLGYSVKINKNTIGISTIQKYPTVNKPPEVIQYSGNIYCCKVPNELIFVRRNGSCTWSHNSYAISYQLQKYIDSLFGGEKSNLVIMGHYHKMFYMFYRNVHAFLPGCLQAQTPFQKGKKLAAHIGGFIIEIHVDSDGTITRCKNEFIPCYKPVLPEF